MKRTSYLFLFIFCLFVSACYQEEDILILNQKEDIVLVEQDYNTPDSSPEYRVSPFSRETEDEKFERYLQWVSFISGRVIRYHLDARQEINSLLGTGQNVFTLTSLLDESPNAIAPNFNTHFRSILFYYIMIIEELGRPQLGLDIPPIAPTDEDIVFSQEGSFSDFLDYMLQDNCVELYFPKDLVFPTNFQITSTAHPLTDAVSNYGYLRHHDPIYTIAGTGLGNPNGPILIEKIEVIDPSYVEANDNIIVARPYRVFIGTGDTPICHYEDYPSDFTLFLDY